MGSRAVVIVGRDEEAIRRRFGIAGEGCGIVYTRTGRRFFDEGQREAEFLDRIATALTATGFWDEFKTGWACLDCELMPWSAKAQALLKQQYAAVGAASRAALGEVNASLAAAKAAGLAVDDLLARHRDRAEMTSQYVRAYQHMLAGGIARRSEVGAVSSARDGGPGACRPRSRLAHGDARQGLQRRAAAVAGHTAPARGPDRPGRGAGGHDWWRS